MNLKEIFELEQSWFLLSLWLLWLATKWLRILLLGSIGKIRNQLIANPIFRFIVLEILFVFVYMKNLKF